jgi:hypothetical protein
LAVCSALFTNWSEQLLLVQCPALYWVPVTMALPGELRGGHVFRGTQALRAGSGPFVSIVCQVPREHLSVGPVCTWTDAVWDWPGLGTIVASGHHEGRVSVCFKRCVQGLPLTLVNVSVIWKCVLGRLSYRKVRLDLTPLTWKKLEQCSY